MGAVHLLETLSQDREVERFREKVGGANLVGTANRLWIILRRDHHDRDVPAAPLGTHACASLEPVEVGHTDVHHDDVRLDALNGLARVDAIRRFFDGPAVRFKCRPDKDSGRRVVVSDERNPFRRGVRGGS